MRNQLSKRECESQGIYHFIVFIVGSPTSQSAHLDLIMQFIFLNGFLFAIPQKTS